MLDFLTGSEAFTTVVTIAGISTFFGIVASRGSSRRISTLQNENRRLKNMLADVMLDKAFARDARS